MGPGERQAVVLGASMSGLLAARALADFYDRVTLIERDELPAGAHQRRGIPQGKHFHTLLPRGVQVLDALFPGLIAELVDAGAPSSNMALDVRSILSGSELAHVDIGADTIQATRPLLEGAVRDRVADLATVKIMDGYAATSLRTTGDRVTGVGIASSTGRAEILDADLVVDAMGRAGRTRTWLTELGYPAPAEDRITVNVAYVSRLVRLAPGTRPPDGLTLVGPIPGRPRGFVFAAQENDRWMLTVVGLAGDHPSDTDEKAFLAFVESMAPPDLAPVIRAAEPVSELRRFAFPASVRRRYERLRRFPDGLLVIGDAICSFNPIYGQGMTVAAVQAEALGRCLRDGERNLARRYFRAAAKAIEPAWQLAAGGDLALPEIEGHRPLATRLINRYVTRVHRVANRDTAVSAAFYRVGVLLDPPARLLAPRILARVLLSRTPRR